jgi:hypothetical protein
VYTGWGVSGLYAMRVKRSASKAAFRKNIIAIYDRAPVQGSLPQDRSSVAQSQQPGQSAALLGGSE